MRLLVLSLAALAIIPVGCKAKQAPSTPVQNIDPVLPAPVLGQVAVQQMTAPEHRLPGIAFDDQALTLAARQQLETAAIFSATASTPSAHADILLGYAVEDVRAEGKALARAVAKLQVTVKPAKHADPYWAENVEAAGEMQYAVDQDKALSQKAFSSLVTRLTGDLLRDYIARQKLRTVLETEILKLMSQEDGALREEAIRQAGQRKLKSTVDPLLALLTHENEPVRDAALGALLSMRERRAVAVLTESRSMRDRREMRKIVEAVGLLGGDEAVSYLEFVADGNEDEEVRGLAKRTLERMKQRRP